MIVSNATPLIYLAKHGRLHLLKDFKTKKVQMREDMEALGIDKGEAEVIFLAVELNSDEILVDQTHARLAATVFGLKPRGTIYVLL
jgi:predicted nucleic acid-binding protein